MGEPIVDERKKQQAESMQRWLQYAPSPAERGTHIYDAFISYRSSDRAWAMGLYDALKLAGWNPFLDQFFLVPGADLETSLSEALEASSAGVILWSSRTKDSKCVSASAMACGPSRIVKTVPSNICLPSSTPRICRFSP